MSDGISDMMRERERLSLFIEEVWKGVGVELWAGLLSRGDEVEGGDYRRQRVSFCYVGAGCVSNNEDIKFGTPASVNETLEITGFAIYNSEIGGKALFIQKIILPKYLWIKRGDTAMFMKDHILIRSEGEGRREIQLFAGGA